jgi:hypothetical protein
VLALPHLSRISFGNKHIRADSPYGVANYEPRKSVAKITAPTRPALPAPPEPPQDGSPLLLM